MSNLATIPENTLTVDVVKIPFLYVQKTMKIVVRHRFGAVFLCIDNRRVELNTLTAHGIGYAIATAIPTLESNEMILIKINGEKIELLKVFASKLSTGLLRKADDADDWQLNNRRKKA